MLFQMELEWFGNKKKFAVKHLKYYINPHENEKEALKLKSLQWSTDNIFECTSAQWDQRFAGVQLKRWS